jgi:signal transduction histidine kinase
MKLDIRARLALRFTLIVATILILFSSMIYYFSSTYRRSEFYERLRDKALTTAQFLLKVNEVDLDMLRIIDRNTINALYHERVLIYNQRNDLMYNSVDDGQFNVSPELLERIRNAGETHFEFNGDEAIGIMYPFNNDSFVVIASAYDKFGNSKIKNLRWVLVLGCIGSLILTILAGMIYAGRALKPMSDVVKEVDKITISNLHLRVNEGNGTDEIAALAITFNKMLARLESAFHMQRSFVSNASHELRTPLTSITGQIEVSLMNKRNPEEYEAILHSILDDIRNLNLLANGLLDLAKANSDKSGIRFNKLRIDELLWETRTELLKRHQDYTIEIDFESNMDDESRLIVQGNEYLLKVAIQNVMDNACKYSSAKQVLVKLRIENSSLSVAFIDEGIGIKQDELHKVFDAFFRSENAKTFPGHGLGLSLTDRIIQVHNGSLEINSVIEKGTTVTIFLPLSS